MKTMALNTLVAGDSNLGDTVSAPAHYFPELDLQIKDVRELDPTDYTERMVVGGGGMYHGEFILRLRYLAFRGTNFRALWGVGHNEHGGRTIKWPSWVKRFSLVGVRDWGVDGLDWVPCASCLSDLFDNPVEPLEEVVCYEHYDFPLRLSEFPSMGNGYSGNKPFERLREVIAFLSCGETVVTSTYHGAYWATLLGRKVVTVPFSSKFYGFRHPPEFAFGKSWREPIKRARVYPEALEECRAATLAFAERVKEGLL